VLHGQAGVAGGGIRDTGIYFGPFLPESAEYPRSDVFCPEALVKIAAEALSRRAAALAAEHAVYGVDALGEVQLHPLLANAFAGAGLGVLAEQVYPSEPQLTVPGSDPPRSRRQPLRRDRLRCDLVLLPSPTALLIDPVVRRIAAEQAAAAAHGTLFSGLPPPAEHPPPEAVGPEEAFWMEIKSVGQFCYSAGVPGPNRTYSSELLGAAADITKLASDPLIRRGGLLVMLFSAERQTAAHDLEVLQRHCGKRRLPVSAPAHAGLALSDRIGNAWCELALLPLSLA
jgi:hypothetical protein